MTIDCEAIYKTGMIVETDVVINGITEIVGGQVLDTRNLKELKEAELFIRWLDGKKGWHKVWDEGAIVGYQLLIRPSNIMRVYKRVYKHKEVS